jgi:hypothetical protein
MPKISKMKRCKELIVLVLTACFGFFVGNLEFSSPTTNFQPQKINPEISIVQLKKIIGDELYFEISGPVRVLWSWENYVENDGEFTIPLGQIPNENDLKFREFLFVGNQRTMKFYPASSYFARGVEVHNRRFFSTKEAAIAAGFIASKSVK